jgi:hypothetical protein
VKRNAGPSFPDFAALHPGCDTDAIGQKIDRKSSAILLIRGHIRLALAP